jgi:hypothetical protein
MYRVSASAKFPFRITMSMLLASALLVLGSLATPVSSAMASESPIEWAQPLQITSSAGLADVTCPEADLCLATDSSGSLHMSVAPTDPPSWVDVDLTGGTSGLGAISCPSSSFCAVVGEDELFSSTEPAGGAATWTTSTLPALDDISCAGPTFCVGTDQSGEVFTSTDPAGGASAWQATDLELPDWRLGPSVLHTISCPSASLCVAGSDVGTVVTSSNPTGTAAAWTRTFVGGNPKNFNNGAGPSVTGLDCPSTSFCATTTNWGSSASTSVDPLGGKDAWNVSLLDEFFWAHYVGCAGTSFCVTVGQGGYAAAALAPSDPSTAWSKPDQIDAFGEPTAVSCAPGGAVCVVVDAAGYATVGRPQLEVQPAAGGGENAGGKSPDAGPPPPAAKPKAKHRRCARRPHHHHTRDGKRVSSGGKGSRNRCGRRGGKRGGRSA